MSREYTGCRRVERHRSPSLISITAILRWFTSLLIVRIYAEVRKNQLGRGHCPDPHARMSFVFEETSCKWTSFVICWEITCLCTCVAGLGEYISESLISLSKTSVGGVRCPFNKSSLVLHRVFCTIFPLVLMISSLQCYCRLKCIIYVFKISWSLTDR